MQAQGLESILMIFATIECICMNYTLEKLLQYFLQLSVDHLFVVNDDKLLFLSANELLLASICYV